MRRGIHIATAILAVLLLAKPFNCFAGGAWSQKAADCCHKGKCAPGANADDCCKASVPGSSEFLESKAANDSAVDLVSLSGPVLNPVSFAGESLFIVHSPVGSPPGTHLNLPLLI